MEKTTFRHLFGWGILAATVLLSSIPIAAHELVHSENTRRNVSGIQMNMGNGKPLFRGMPIPKDAQALENLKARKLKTQTRTENEIPVTSVIDEDFIYFTAGTEDEPDSETIEDINTWIIPDSYFHQPGWMGSGVQQAGGTCALAYPDYGGCINTPMGD